MSVIIETVAREPIKVVADILQKEMEIPDGQIMLGYQKWDIPTDPGLYVALVYIGGKAIGNNNYFTSSGDEPAQQIEHQEVAMRHVVQIDLLSFDASARIRKEEVLMALRSIYSQQQQEKYAMSIARIPSDLVDASSLEETKMLNRFTLTVPVTALHTKTKAAPYYDKFKTAEVHENE